jgi:hypothetical protein
MDHSVLPLLAFLAWKRESVMAVVGENSEDVAVLVACEEVFAVLHIVFAVFIIMESGGRKSLQIFCRLTMDAVAADNNVGTA